MHSLCDVDEKAIGIFPFFEPAHTHTQLSAAHAIYFIFKQVILINHWQKWNGKRVRLKEREIYSGQTHMICTNKKIRMKLFLYLVRGW